MSITSARSITGTATLANFDPQVRTAILGWEKLIINKADSITDFLPTIYEDETFDAKKIKSGVYSGFGPSGEWDMLSEKNKVDTSYLYEIFAENFAYGSEYEIAFDAQAFDEMFSMNSKRATDYGESLAWTQQIAGAKFLNNAFNADATCKWHTVTGNEAFFSASHSYAPNVAGTTAGVLSGTWSNIGAGVASLTTAMDAFNKLADQRDYVGRPMNLRPVEVLCRPEKVTTWQEILGIGMNGKSGEISNNRNPFQGDWGGIKITPYPYFATTNQWVVKSNKNPLKMTRKIGITIKTISPVSSAEKLIIHGKFTFDAWQESPMGMIGYPG